MGAGSAAVCSRRTAPSRQSTRDQSVTTAARGLRDQEVPAVRLVNPLKLDRRLRQAHPLGEMVAIYADLPRSA